MNLFRIIALAAFLPLLAHGASFPFVTLNGKTNRLSDSGTTLTYNGSAIGGGESMWFNFGGNITPAGMTNIDFSGQFYNIYPDTTLFSYQPNWDPNGLNSDYWFLSSNATNTDYSNNPANLVAALTAYKPAFNGLIHGDPNGWAAGFFSSVKLHREGTASPLDFSGAIPPFMDMGVLAACASEGDNAVGLYGTANNPASTAPFTGPTINGYGVVGYPGDHAGSAVGVAGTAHTGGTNVIGGLFAVFGSTKTVTPNASAALMLDSMDTGLPLIVGRTNNGTQTFSVASSGAVASSSSYTSGAPSGGTAAAWKLGVASGDVELDVSGTLNHLKTRVEPLQSLTWGSTTTLDAAETIPNYRTLTLGGNTTLATSNRAAGHWFSVILSGAATNCTLTLPSWHFMSQVAPASLLANKKATLTVLFVDGVETNAIANYAVEP